MFDQIKNIGDVNTVVGNIQDQFNNITEKVEVFNIPNTLNDSNIIAGITNISNLNE